MTDCGGQGLPRPTASTAMIVLSADGTHYTLSASPRPSRKVNGLDTSKLQHLSREEALACSAGPGAKA
jgi:hypothetical protein